LRSSASLTLEGKGKKREDKEEKGGENHLYNNLRHGKKSLKNLYSIIL